jgi:PAS domain S-box-containing protein
MNIEVAFNDLEEAEAKYRGMFENAVEGIYQSTPDGRYLTVNAALARLYGYERPEELLNQVSDIQNEIYVDPSMRELFRREIESAGFVRGLEYQVRRRDGRIIWISESARMVCNTEGGVRYYEGFIDDITARKEAEAELNYERDLLGALMDGSEEHIYFKDLESRFIRCSAALVRVLNMKSAKEVVGKRDSDFFSKEHASAAFDDEQKIIRSGEPTIGKVEKETWLDGHVTWALSSKMPLRNREGKIVGTFGISKDITPIKDAEAKLDQVHKQLLEASRQAGMAEVATSVLHNVGNVLNSVNVSGSLIADKVRNSRVVNLAKIVTLLQAHKTDFASFFNENPKGKQLPGYLAELAAHLTQEQADILHEVGSLVENITHIKEIVTMQQNYASSSGILESLKAADLVEDALRMNLGAMSRHNVKVERDFADVPPILTEKHKVLQILVNLIRNAKYACDDSGRDDKLIRLQVRNGDGRVKISVTDNGVGITADNLTRIFNHGFTTRKDGHGFGLHSGALAAKELGGTLVVFSEGTGRGAAFTLELPTQPPESDS